ncbi:MAG: tRNA (adenosine(37)-N6)-threonylcarbamoyltransferase complex ATPase subunit type 1 TsaE [bacterium]
MEKDKKFELVTLTDTAQLAVEIVSLISENMKHSDVGAQVVLLSGTLGTGKTTLSQAIAKELGVTETVISPTFILMKRYESQNDLIKNLVHIDAYRLENKEEMSRLEWEALINQNNTLILLEWPEKVSGILLPEKTITVSLVHESEGRRRATISF